MKTPDKKIIEIADFLFANPQAGRKDILAKFGKEWQSLSISTRTIDRLLKQAKTYNETRLGKQEQIREKTLEKQTEKSVEKNILSRENALEILSAIATGKAKKLPVKSGVTDGREIPVLYEIVYPSDRERIAAIGKLADMQGWDTPKGYEISGKNGEPIKFEGFNFLPE